MFSEIEFRIHYKLSFRNFSFAKSHRNLFHSASRIPNPTMWVAGAWNLLFAIFHPATRILNFRNAGCESIFVSIVCHPATRILEFQNAGCGIENFQIINFKLPQPALRDAECKKCLWDFANYKNPKDNL